MISKHLNRAKSFQAALLAFIVFSLVMLPVKNGYILRWYDEMSIFLSGDIYLNRMLHYPGGIGSMPGHGSPNSCTIPGQGAAYSSRYG